MTTISAIDPGVTGALAFYLPDFPDRVSVLDMPLVDGGINAHALRDMIETYVELFARQQWPGWICIGDELRKFQPPPAEAAE